MDKPADGVESDLADLVNMAGKMRMLSHRTVMFALLARDHPDHAGQRDAALSEFEKLRDILTNPVKNGHFGQHTQEALNAVTAISPAQLAVLSEFSQRVRTALNGHNASDTPLADLGTFVASDLLKTLNQINDGIRKALAYVAEQRRDSERPIINAIGDTLRQIDRLANSLRMVATNASIEAQRSGDAGRSFRVLAEEMRSLSDRSRGYADNLGDLLSKVKS